MTPNSDLRFSIVVTCYNYASYLRKSVGSVIAQTYKNFEIIIVNDGSTDSSLEVAGQIKAENSEVDIKIIDQANSGQPAISRNNGIAVASGEFILCLDADDFLAPTILEKASLAIDANPEISLVYFDAIFFDEVKTWFQPSGEFDLVKIAVDNQLFCCTIYRKSAWSKAGGYKTNVRGYEDWDLWISFAEQYLVAYKIPEPLFYYRTSKDGVFGSTEDKDLYLQANMVTNHPGLYDEATEKWARDFLLNKPKS